MAQYILELNAIEDHDYFSEAVQSIILTQHIENVCHNEKKG